MSFNADSIAEGISIIIIIIIMVWGTSWAIRYSLRPGMCNDIELVCSSIALHAHCLWMLEVIVNQGPAVIFRWNITILIIVAIGVNSGKTLDQKFIFELLCASSIFAVNKV